MNKITGVLHLIILVIIYNSSYDDTVTHHHIKFDLIEDKYVKRWQQDIKFGHWIIADKLCVYWMVSLISYNWTGSKTNSYRTGATTLHSLAVIHRNLQFYKLYAYTYGGESNGNI